MGFVVIRQSCRNFVEQLYNNTEVIIDNVSVFRKVAFENCRKVVEPGKKYVIKQVGESKGLIGKAIYGIVEVDIFDSDL